MQALYNPSGLSEVQQAANHTEHSNRPTISIAIFSPHCKLTGTMNQPGIDMKPNKSLWGCTRLPIRYGSNDYATTETVSSVQ